MWIILLFWALLWIPGALLVRRHLPELCEGGWIVVLPLGYVGTLALLTPVAWLGFAFGGALWILLATVAALVVGALLLLVLGRVSRPRWPPLDLLAVATALVVLVELVAGVRQGSHFGGDAGYHVARIRSLLDDGFNNVSPLIAGRVERVYFGNLYHAVIACSALVARTAPADAWAYVFPFAKLFVSTGSGALAFSLLRERWAACLAAALSAVWWGPLSILSYPNKVAPLALLPIGIALWVQAVRSPGRRGPVLWLAAVSVVMSEFHALYTVLLVLCLAPGTLAIGLWRLRRDRARGLSTLVLLLAMGAGGPQLLASRLVPEVEVEVALSGSYPDVPAGIALPAVEHPAKKTVARGLVQVGDDLYMASARRWVAWTSPYPYALLLPVLLAIRRREVEPLLVLAPLVSLGVFLHVPWLCGALVRAAGAPWIVGRFNVGFSVVVDSVVPGLVAATAMVIATRSWARHAALAASLVGAIGYAHARGIDKSVWKREPLAQRLAPNPELSEHLARLRSNRALLRAHVPPGSLVCAKPKKDYQLLMLHAVYPLAIHPVRGTKGVANMRRRQRDARYMIAVRGSGPHKIALARHYGVRFLWLSRKHARRVRRAYGPLVTGMWHSGGRSLIGLRQ